MNDRETLPVTPAYAHDNDASFAVITCAMPFFFQADMMDDLFNLATVEVRPN
jgi:hypothetical protein